MEAFKAYIEQHTAKPEEKEDEIEATVQEAGVLQLTGENFNHAIEKGVTIVKFFAPWYVHGEANSFQHFIERNKSIFYFQTQVRSLQTYVSNMG